MAYTALTCDEQQQSVETLLARAMVVKDDGSWAFQTVSIVLSIFIESGSVTDYFDLNGEYEGYDKYTRRGDPDTLWWCIRANQSVAEGNTWCITDENGGALYYSLDDVLDPRLCTTWFSLGGLEPLPIII